MNYFIFRSRDLELLAKAAIDKQSAADQKYAEAENIQRKYEERIRRIQEHVVSLNSREKQIAREKVALSRERLSLHNERKLIDNRQQCSLCKSIQNPSDFEFKYPTPETYLGVSRDYNVLEVSSAMNNIEQEMANFLGRNLGLKAVVAETPVNVDKQNQDNIFQGDLTSRTYESHGKVSFIF